MMNFQKSITLSAEELFALCANKTTTSLTLNTASDLTTASLTAGSTVRFQIPTFEGFADYNGAYEIVSVTMFYELVTATGALTCEFHKVSAGTSTVAPSASTIADTGTLSTTIAYHMDTIRPATELKLVKGEQVYLEVTAGAGNPKIYKFEIVYTNVTE